MSGASGAKTTLEKQLDELYRDDPKGFVARRDELARSLRGAGDRDAADRVKRLRRPTVAAWLINRGALESPAEAREFAAASRELETVQRRALGGERGAAEEWRAAAAREREATEALADAARRGARSVGHAVSPRSLELVIDTLRAASGDPDLRDRVVRGRVEREQSAATLGGAALGEVAPRPRAAAKRRDVAEARRELRRLESELADAEARADRLRIRVEETAEALRREKAKLAEARRDSAFLKRRLKAAERKAR